jgi:hypothetical protein
MASGFKSRAVCWLYFFFLFLLSPGRKRKFVCENPWIQFFADSREKIETNFWPLRRASCFNQQMAMIMNSNCCASCNLITPSARACTGCFQVKYCDGNCQNRHWQQHKAFCRANEAKMTLVFTIHQGERIPELPKYCTASFDEKRISAKELKKLLKDKDVSSRTHGGVAIRVLFTKNAAGPVNQCALRIFNISEQGDCHIVFDLSVVSEKRANACIANMKDLLMSAGALPWSDDCIAGCQGPTMWFIQNGVVFTTNNGGDRAEIPHIPWTEFLQDVWTGLLVTVNNPHEIFNNMLRDVMLKEVRNLPVHMKNMVVEETNRFVRGIGGRI